MDKANSFVLTEQRSFIVASDIVKKLNAYKIHSVIVPTSSNITGKIIIFYRVVIDEDNIVGFEGLTTNREKKYVIDKMLKAQGKSLRWLFHGIDA